MTTPKNAISIASTMEPVSCFGDLERLAMIGSSLRKSGQKSGTDEIVGCRGDYAETDIGDVKLHRHRLLRIARGRRGDEDTQLLAPVAADHDHRAVGDDGIGANDVDGGIRRAFDVDRDDAVEAM